MLLSRRRKEWVWWLDWVCISCVDMGWAEQDGNGVLSPGRKKKPFALDVELLLGFDSGTKLLDLLPRLVFFLSNKC